MAGYVCRTVHGSVSFSCICMWAVPWAASGSRPAPSCDAARSWHTAPHHARAPCTAVAFARTHVAACALAHCGGSRASTGLLTELRRAGFRFLPCHGTRWVRVYV